MIEFGDYFKQFLVWILSNFHLFLNIFIAALTKTGFSGDFFMKKHIFISFIKRLGLVFLLIIQTGAFSLNPRLPTTYPEQWATCAPNNEQAIIYNENSTLHLKTAEQSCTMVVVGNHTHLIIHSNNTHLLSVPINVENGWLYLGGEKSLNLYYSGIYKITIQGKLQEVTLQLPIPNSKVIYENGTNHDYRRLRSAEQLFVPLEFQSHTVTLLSNNIT
jgi:hypothetical protein